MYELPKKKKMFDIPCQNHVAWCLHFLTYYLFHMIPITKLERNQKQKKEGIKGIWTKNSIPFSVICSRGTTLPL